MGDQPEDPAPPEELGAVLEEIRPHLLRLARRMCANPADAEDYVQDIMQRTLEHGLPPGIRNVAGWLTTMLKNYIIDRRRIDDRRPPHQTMNDHTETLTRLEPEGPEPAWSKITPADVRAALQDLEPVYRKVYELHTFEHRSYAQLAEQLGIERVTVGTRLNRARGKLRAVLVKRFGLGDAS